MNFDINTAFLFGIAVMNAIAAVAVWQTRKDTAETRKVATETREDTAQIKVHTNSMQTALLNSEKELAGLRAVEVRRVEEERNAAERAKGVIQGQMTATVETAVAENGKHATEPVKVEVVNKEKPVPVAITPGAVGTITEAVKSATKKPRAATPRKKAKLIGRARR